ncbi:MAG: signal recognition particle-docking protein FtsY [Nitratireductor sp.]
MAEKKPGFLKKIFSFGFGKKAEEPEVEAPKELEAPKAEAEKAAKAPKAKSADKKTDKAAPKEKSKKKKEKAKAAPSKKADAKAKTKVEAKDAKPKKTKEEKAPKVAEKKSAKKLANNDAVDATEKPFVQTKQENKQEPVQEPIAEAPEATALTPEVEAETKPVKKTPTKTAVTLTERKEPAQEVAPIVEQPVEEKKQGWLKRLTKGLSRSSEALTENITKVFTDKKLDDDTLQDLEDILLQADLGIETAMKITDALAEQKFGKSVTDEEVREIMAEEIEKILAPVAIDLDLDLEHQPHVILMIGVNGSGKTTTIGKLGQKLYDAGFSTSLVAGDTFRAAAIEQLKIWGERTQSPVLFRELGADAAGLAYDAWDNTREDRRDVMLMDTAGRLQNKKELMEELEKIVRVLKKQDESAPQTVLLTLDATTGQNAMNQVEIFKEVAGVNGIVMTKLDGTARGGILVAIAAKYKLPVYFVGVGEGVEDLEPFEARDFARSIVGLPKEDE